jgi:hypothetical protein
MPRNSQVIPLGVIMSSFNAFMTLLDIQDLSTVCQVLRNEKIEDKMNSKKEAHGQDRVSQLLLMAF